MMVVVVVAVVVVAAAAVVMMMMMMMVMMMTTIIIIIIIMTPRGAIVGFWQSTLTAPRTVSSTQAHVENVQCGSKSRATHHLGFIGRGDSLAVNSFLKS